MPTVRTSLRYPLRKPRNYTWSRLGCPSTARNLKFSGAKYQVSTRYPRGVDRRILSVGTSLTFVIDRREGGQQMAQIVTGPEQTRTDKPETFDEPVDTGTANVAVADIKAPDGKKSGPSLVIRVSE